MTYKTLHRKLKIEQNSGELGCPGRVSNWFILGFISLISTNN